MYFDYEREFSGHKTMISDNDIESILEILPNANIKTTWFTVGKILDKYPNSIEAIIRNGHEIGSHTYNHISPLYTSSNKLDEDFRFFSEASCKYKEITGFHSPKGKWSSSMIQLLVKNSFTYDVAGVVKSNKKDLLIIKKNGIEVLYRIFFLGDNWQLFNTNPWKKMYLII